MIDRKSQEVLPGASLRVKNGKLGTLADASGNYQLNITQLPQTIVVTYIGYQSQELTINKDELNKVIKPEQQQSLSEVVVTAVGIKSATRSLGYSVGEVKGADLKDSREPNVVAALSGKVAGVQINNSGRPSAIF